VSEDLSLLDATAQAELVRTGQVSAAELVTAAIDRIETLNPVLNAVVTPVFERAADAARPGPAGPFAGVPYLVKDLACEMEGVRFTEGSRFLACNVSTFDSELVLRLRRAGLVILGRTNTPEFGMALLDATSGPDLGDPYWAPPPARPFLAEVGADPGRLRIGYTVRTPDGDLGHPDCVAAAEHAARLCARLRRVSHAHDVQPAAADRHDGLDVRGSVAVAPGQRAERALRGRRRQPDRQPRDVRPALVERRGSADRRALPRPLRR